MSALIDLFEIKEGLVQVHTVLKAGDSASAEALITSFIKIIDREIDDYVSQLELIFKEEQNEHFL